MPYGDAVACCMGMVLHPQYTVLLRMIICCPQGQQCHMQREDSAACRKETEPHLQARVSNHAAGGCGCHSAACMALHGTGSYQR